MAGMYIAKCKCRCGGIIFACVDDPEYAKDTAKDVAQVIKHGYTVRKMTGKQFSKVEFGCKRRLMRPAPSGRAG